MSADIRFASGDDEHLAAYRLRSAVFAGEGILDRDGGTPLVEVFDALPSSRLVVAVDRGEVVGTVRITQHHDGPSPTDHYFDAAVGLPVGAVLGSGSLLCVDPRHRSASLGLRLVEFGMRALHRVGCSDGAAPIRPEAVPIFLRLGWREIGACFVHPVERVPVVPMGVRLAEWFDRAQAASSTRPLAVR